MDRKIIHVDMDAFFAAVEVRDNPSLKGKPVIVGGVSERGVVCTCSYEARVFGIKSAMPGFIAKKKCPKGIFINPRIQRYKEVSSRIFETFYGITPYVEPVSIDEAYLDITHIKENPIYIAEIIKNDVLKKEGLTLSVGISYNKFLAKIASDWNKPNGIKIIERKMVPKILFDLPINKVHGLGSKSVKKLNNIGVFNIEQLHELSKEFMIEYLGKMGAEVYNRIRGVDNREINIFRERKSVGREITLKRDTNNKTELSIYIRRFSNSIAQTLKKLNIRGKTITIKLKTSSFENHTKSKTLNRYIFKEEEIYEEAINILNDIVLDSDIRLIGVSISSLKENTKEQLSLF